MGRRAPSPSWPRWSPPSRRRSARGAGSHPRGARPNALALLAGLQAAAVAVGAEGAEVQDALAVAHLPRAVELDAGRVLTGAAVDRAATVVGPDVVLAGAALDDGRAVAGIEPVVAGAAVEHVLLVGGVGQRIPVAPQDVVARAAEDPVRAVMAEQLVVG